ncbi:MAG TPA: sugar ABC transporter substrate-binding protein [Thermomicrobiales bacterium]|nr:sugar ABC transporter substrate-binding protein [Thermomicrobiales bacterium]
MAEPTGRINRRNLLLTAGAGLSSLAIGSATTPAIAAAPAFLRQEQTLRIAFEGTAVDPLDQQLADGFKEQFPDANIEFIPIQGTDWNEYFAKVLTMIASGTAPDIMSVATEGTQLFAGQGLSTPLDDYVKRDQAELEEYFADVHPSLVEAMMYEGSLYQLPRDFNAANMYINTTLFEEHGIDYPATDWDKDTFYQIARTLTAENGGPPFGYGWTNRLWGSWMPWIFVNDSNLLTEERAPGGEWLWDAFYADADDTVQRGGGWRWEAPQANAPANVEALEFVVQMAQEGITPSVSEGGGDLLQGFFTSNSLGMTPAGGFWAGGLNEAGMTPDAFDVQYFPKWKSQRHQFGTAGYVILESSQAKDLAWEFLKYVVSKPAMELSFGGNFSTPVRRSMLTAEQYSPTGPQHWEVFYGTLDEHPETAPIPAPPQANEMTSIFMRYTGLALTFSQSPQEALDSMQAELEELFAQEG